MAIVAHNHLSLEAVAEARSTVNGEEPQSTKNRLKVLSCFSRLLDSAFPESLLHNGFIEDQCAQ